VSADRFQKSDGSPLATLDGGVSVTFFGSGDSPASLLTADRARIDADSYDMTILGNVVLAADEGTRLETDSLRWSRETERISGEGDVTIRRQDGVETGVGFEAASDLKEWSLRRVTTHLGTPNSSTASPAAIDSVSPLSGP